MPNQIKPCPTDNDGYPIIKVKDVVAYLQSLDQEAVTYLDKDGWSDGLMGGESAQEVIFNSGVFDYDGDDEDDCSLCINN